MRAFPFALTIPINRKTIVPLVAALVLLCFVVFKHATRQEQWVAMEQALRADAALQASVNEEMLELKPEFGFLGNSNDNDLIRFRFNVVITTASGKKPYAVDMRKTPTTPWRVYHFEKQG